MEKEPQYGHVYYFEPNDLAIGRDQDGADVPLMPHLEDLCIAMSLTADIYPRKKSSISVKDKANDAQRVQMKLSWISYIHPDGSTYQLTSAGTEMNDERFLTTYYTEISANKYIENEIVEGLGITGINISFESWYTPTITINFVDVHGSSLWGREEAIHDNGEINASNILGVFFTQPYPLFRLQVKGFLGQAVTYQLSVSSFKGRYNSQTGNFEATATFIGYSYSLLTDIPLKCLSFIAEMDYVGRSYWENKINQPDWQLPNADGTYTQPMPLFVLIENIRSAIGSLDSIKTKNCEGVDIKTTVANGDGNVKSAVEKDQSVPLGAAATVTNATNANTELGEVAKALERFVNAFKKYANGKGGVYSICSDGKKNKQMIMLINGDKGGDNAKVIMAKPNDELRLSYIAYNGAIEKYNKTHKNKLKNYTTEDSPTFHKNAITSKSGDLYLYGERIFKCYNNEGVQRTIVYGNKKWEDIKINNQTLYKETIGFLKQQLYISKDTPEFGILINLGQIEYDLNTISKQINSSATNIETATENKVANQSNSTQIVKSGAKTANDEVIEETQKYKIQQIIGFEPTIGNFVKLLMCHLETFAEIMFKCGENIYNNKANRTPQKMGVNGLEDTDIPENGTSPQDTKGNGDGDWIFPWPALYNPNFDSNNSETNVIGKQSNVLGWPEDYPTKNGGEWEEAKVVRSFLDAISRYEEMVNGKYNGKVSNTYSSLPMSGIDLTTLSSPFKSVGAICTKDIESLAGYLGLRIAQTIGVADNKCDSEIAKAIGSIDAINLIQAYCNPKALREAINPKDGKQNFAQRILDYITCNNKTKPTSETERGVGYNIFETTSKGTYYNRKRHPFFVSNGGDEYKYSYGYSMNEDEKNLVSIVPTELKSFTRNGNAYANVLIPNSSGEYTKFTPKVTTSGLNNNQGWVYTSKSDDIDAVKGVDNYTNEQLFTIVSQPTMVDSLIKQVDALKGGTLKINNYGIKGSKDDANVKKFIERRYQLNLTDYSNFFFGSKNYRILGQTLSTVDEKYTKEHLCLTNDQKDKVKFDTQWSYDTNSELFKKTTLQNGKDNVSFKNGTKNIPIEEVNVIDLPIMVNSKTVGSLFGSHLYYLQNEITDSKMRMLAKAYLIFTSMMAGIDKPEEAFFKSDSKSLIKLIPPFYLLFLGALLWRKNLKDDNDLYFGDFKEVAPDKDTSLISKSEKVLYIDTQNKMDWYKIEDYYMPYDNIDKSVKNRLINFFEYFGTSKIIGDIINHCELITAEKKLINDSEWKKLKEGWSKQDFDVKNPENWATLFGDTFHKFSSFNLPESKQVLRLLINEKNESVSQLNFLYGFNNPFVIGRATTKRVGLGDKEIKVTKSQIMGYLNGFESRIKELKEETKKEEKKSESSSSPTVDRDHAVPLYYSLKHVWDTWLITANRDQFTIKEFFNKYFVFMDSFYMNMYNNIKLNAEIIEKAYNQKEQNLLTYITNITSEERCMFFALPEFIDSNNYDDSGDTSIGGYRNKYNGNDFAWKRETLKNMFTPIPYNEMVPATPNNVFVFIYTHKFSDCASENTDKRFDSYMMNNRETWPGVLMNPTVNGLKGGSDRAYDENDETQYPRPNNSLTVDDAELVSGRYGYMMPCFGVTVNRGNNYIFKSINVNMDSPKITAVSAQTWENILSKTGADGSKRIFFHGQDIYPIYSQYSYACEIEMMGCAQIQPLMYFQLLNLPMWRGTYMIYKVTHSMTPGNMTTKFVGMKMSRISTPYATGYFTVGKRSVQQGVSVNINGQTSNQENSPTAQLPSSSISGGFVGGEKMVQAIFGDKKKHPVTSPYGVNRGNHRHGGTDIGAGEGTILYAPWDGTIVANTVFGPKNANATSVTQKWDNAGGIRVRVRSSNGKYEVCYMHCQELLIKKVGERVKAGTPVAKVGHTGFNGSNKSPIKAHLHLELKIDGKKVDPMREVGTV